MNERMKNGRKVHLNTDCNDDDNIDGEADDDNKNGDNSEVLNQ